MPLSLTKPAFITDRVCDYLRSQVGKSEPFMAFASFLEPHPPYTGPYDDLFDWEQIELPENFNQLPGAIDSVKASLMGIYYRLHGSSGFTLSSDDDWRRLIARYYGLCRQVDEGIGKLMHTLEETGLAENTIVVFTSDHGDQMGDHNCLQKGVLYEESIRVPLILRTPGKPGNRQYDYPVSHIDLVPTLLDLLGEEIPSALPGKSLVDILTGELNCPSGSVVVEWNAARQGLDAPDGGAVGMREEMIRLGEEAYGRQRSESAVRSDGRSLIAPNGWKYNLYADGIEELFNLELDPHELTNLTDDQQYIVLKQDLQDQLQAWMLHNDDSFTRSSL